MCSLADVTVFLMQEHIPTERRKATQQYVSDDTSCPNVDLETISEIEGDSIRCQRD